MRGPAPSEKEKREAEAMMRTDVPLAGPGNRKFDPVKNKHKRKLARQARRRNR